MRRAEIPQHIVAAQREPALDRETGYRIGRAIIVFTRGAAVHIEPFHIILGHDETCLLQHQCDKAGVVGDLRGRDRGSVAEPLLRRQAVQCLGLLCVDGGRSEQRGNAAEPGHAAAENATTPQTATPDPPAAHCGGGLPIGVAGGTRAAGRQMLEIRPCGHIRGAAWGDVADLFPIAASAGGVTFEAADIAAFEQCRCRMWRPGERLIDIGARRVEAVERAIGRGAVDQRIDPIGVGL